LQHEFLFLSCVNGLVGFLLLQAYADKKLVVAP